MDSKGRPTASDIDDRDMLLAIKETFEKNRFRGPLEAEYGFIGKFNVPSKVIFAKCAKLAKRGLLEVTADNYPRWLTEKGEAFLMAPKTSKDSI